MIIDMLHIQHNKLEYLEPEKYIPERFDQDSKYFLTPEGKKRHPMSYAPFLGGKRICLGKTFVETMSKIIGPSIIGNFDFEFVEKKHYTSKPANTLVCLHQPVVMVNLIEYKFHWYSDYF